MATNDLEQLLLQLAKEFPDPVDVFEDGVARRLGLARGPGCDQDTWRQLRVRFIDAAEGSDEENCRERHRRPVSPA